MKDFIESVLSPEVPAELQGSGGGDVFEAPSALERTDDGLEPVYEEREETLSSRIDRLSSSGGGDVTEAPSSIEPEYRQD